MLLVGESPEEEELVSTALFNLSKLELRELAEMEETAEKTINKVDYAESVKDYLAANMFSMLNDCTGQTTAYLKQIADMTFILSKMNEMTERMADSLAEIDPNTLNGEEGLAFVRKIYKMKGVTPLESKPKYPATEQKCMDKVAGKVI